MLFSIIWKKGAVIIARQTRKQHFVPRFYLKRFTNPDNKLYVYDLQNKKMLPQPIPYASQCYKDYFYGEDGLWESRLCYMEGKWAATVRKVFNQKILTDEDNVLLKEFVLYQRQRTYAKQNHSVEERKSIMLECSRMLYLYHGWEFGDEAIELCNRRIREEITPAENVEMATRLVDLIDDLNVLIVHFNTSKKLMTSDAPVIALNAFLDFQGHGYGNVGIIFLLPLSPEHLLVVYDAKLYKKYKETMYLESDNEEDIESVNRYEMIHAERMVFSMLPGEFGVVADDLYEKRNQEIQRNKPQYLGPDGQKLIITSSPGTKYYYELSFINLPREWRRIPFHCKEPIPRQYEKGWDTKLAEKYKVLCIAKGLDIECGLPSKKDLKMGCRRMESVAKLYWQSM